MIKAISAKGRFSPKQADLELPGVEPAFILDRWHRLRAPRLLDRDRLVRYFAHQVARTPTDLLTHTRRILYHIAKNDSSGVHGALLDLYLVLGDKGYELRRRMYQKARQFFSSEQKEHFVFSQRTGIDRSHPLPASKDSVLGDFFTGTGLLVMKRDKPSSIQPLSIVDEAQSLLEAGRVDDARKLLEKGVLADPLNSELNKALLEIYYHARTKKDFLKMCMRLGGKATAIPNQWKKLAYFFSRTKNR